MQYLLGILTGFCMAIVVFLIGPFYYDPGEARMQKNGLSKNQREIFVLGWNENAKYEWQSWSDWNGTLVIYRDQERWSRACQTLGSLVHTPLK